MRFGVIIVNAGVPEWQAFYADYKSLKKLISPYFKLSKGKTTYFLKLRNIVFHKTYLEREGVVITNFTLSDSENLRKFHQYFKRLIFFELVKVRKIFIFG